jgi:Flp pilus assembly pilin Flp
LNVAYRQIYLPSLHLSKSSALILGAKLRGFHVRRNMAERALRIARLCGRFASIESGSSAVEYALVASVIAIVIIVPVTQVGSYLIEVFDTVATALSRAVP